VIQARFAGSGGQGIQFAGSVLAEAAAVYEGHNTVQVSSFGPEARGGSTKCDVLISSRTIYYPRARSLDVFLAMNQKSSDRYYADLKEHGCFVIDSGSVSAAAELDAIGFPITQVALEEIKNVITASMIGLGIVVGLTKIVSDEAVIKALMDRTPPRVAEINRQALERGLKMGSRARRSVRPHVLHA